MSNKNKVAGKSYYFVIMSVVFIFFFYLSYNTPLTGDDWTWGTDRGILRLKNLFDGYNGRYISNVLEILLTRSDLLRYFIVAIFSTLLVYLLGKIFDNKNSILYSTFAFVLLLLMPVNIYSQTFGWTAGFVNYVVSMVFLLTYMVITNNIYRDKTPVYSRNLWILMVPLGITTQLLVEHVSLFALAFGAYVVLYSYVKFKKIFLTHIAYFFSLLIGSVIMFTNKAYTNVLLGNDSYRTIKNSEATESLSVLEKIYNAYVGEMHEYLFLDSSMINIFIGVMILVLLFNPINIIKHGLFKYILKKVLLFNVVGAILFLLTVKTTLGENYFGNRTNDFEALISLLFFISVVFTIIFFVDVPKIKHKLLLYFSGVILLTAPFVFITPYGPRAALAAYVFLVLIGLELFKYNKNKMEWSDEIIKKILLVISVILILFYSIIFTRIGITNRERLDHFQTEVNNGEMYVELTELPHSQFLWMSSTKRKHFQMMYKRYYNIPEEVEIKFIPYYKKE